MVIKTKNASISSGSKLVNSAEEAGGNIIKTSFDTQINCAQLVSNNIWKALSFTQMQDACIKRVAKALDRMSELSVMALDVSRGDADRALYNREFQSLGLFIDNSASKDFNGISLFSSNALNVTINADAEIKCLSPINLSSVIYGTAIRSNLLTTVAAISALSTVKTAVNQVAIDRALIGANQGMLNMCQEQITVLKESLTAANSRIKYLTVSEEITQYARYVILFQSRTSMLSQANSNYQSVLKLLL